MATITRAGEDNDAVTAAPIPVVPPRRTRLLLSALAAATLAVTLLFAPHGLPFVPFCWFHSMTGLPCPGCGLTRSVLAIGSGEFAAAWQFNPFGYLVYAVLLVLVVLPLLGRVAPRLTTALESSRFINAFIGFGVGGLVIYGLVRLSSLAG